MQNSESIPLTASELGYLWTGYSINQMSKWYLTIFGAHSKDDEIKDLFEFALQNTNEILEGRGKLLSQDGYPTPVGFSELDMDLSSPPIYSDRFMMSYLLGGIRLGLEFHSRSLALVTRDDVRQHCKSCLQSSIKLNDKVVRLLLNKGLYQRTPHLPEPNAPEYIKKSSYLNGWFGDSRPINSIEIANLYHIIDLLVIMETLSLGFAQTSKSDEVVELLGKGVTVINNQYQVLAELLEKEHLPVPPSFVAELTNSTKRVFSDRIMVAHIAGLFGSLLSQYGFSMGAIMKHDLVTTYSTQISKAGAHCEKITRFLIEKEWLEKVPGAIPRGNG